MAGEGDRHDSGRVAPAATSRRRRDVAGVLLVVLVAAALRLSGASWDLHRLLHPDERFLATTTARLAVPATPLAYLDPARSPLNPRTPDAWFAYGSLPTTLNRLAVAATGRDATPVVAAWTGRALSACADLLTVVFVFVMGRRLYDASTALVAATLYACAVLAIQHSHFFVVDSFLTTACTATLAALASVVATGSRRAAAAAGAGIGVAFACKVTGVLLVVPAVIACAALTWRAACAGDPLARRRGVRAAAWLLVVVGLAALAAAKVAAPDAFASLWSLRPGGTWMNDVTRSFVGASGGFDWPPDHQWAHRATLLFPLWNLATVGMGPALGLTALGALAVAAWRVIGDWRAPHLLPVTWTLVVLGAVGTSSAATLRYLLPAYPVLCLLAAWALVAIARSGAAGWSWRSITSRAPLVFVVVATAVWALAFTAIYRQSHTRIAASRWIYDHVAAGAALGVEAWDDRLPLVANRRERPDRYRILTLPVTDEEAAPKLDALVTALASLDYIVVSSDRNALSLPRLPRRFPLMVRYYEALDDGRLGFDRVAEFVSYPRLGRLVFRDTAFEEAFSVYDHPRVRIYRKGAGVTPASVRAVFADVSLDDVLRVSARQASRAPTLLAMPPGRADALAREGTWLRAAGEGGRFTAASRGQARGLWRWCLLIALLWMAAWPAVAVLFDRLPDRGWLAAPAVGVLWVAWVAWLWGSVAPWPLSRAVIIGAFATLPAVSLVCAWSSRRTLAAWARAHRRLLVAETMVVVVLGAAMLALRAANPDLWHPTLGGEKPMDVAILNAIVRADRFPAFDPWFAGGTLNYYYFGFVPVAMLARVASIEPAIAYSLAVATWFALASGLAAMLASALATSMSAGREARATVVATGIAGALLAMVSGNLTQWGVLWRTWRETGAGWQVFWDASRAIPVPAGAIAPITEFPFFTFLFGDLHAHLLSMPWFLLGVAAAVQFVCAARAACAGAASTSPSLAPLVVAGWVVGALMATNAWDAPTLFVIVTTSVAGACLWQVPASAWPQRARTIVVRLALVTAVAVLAFAPFLAHYVAPVEGIGPWRGPRTPPAAWLAIWGPFALVQALFVAACIDDRRRGRLDPVHAWCAGVSLVTLGVILAVEVVVARGDTGRMNTVFKFYLQAWMLWSVLTAAVLPRVWGWLGGVRPPWRLVLRMVPTTLLVAMFAYPVTAPVARIAHRAVADAPRGLDGTRFLETAQFTVGNAVVRGADDAAAIRWLLDNVAGTPVVIEAQSPSYYWTGRISAFTGLPTVLGWTWHARQQRAALPDEVVTRRARDVKQFYESVSIDEADLIARRYDISYAIVGGVERARYAGSGLDKFATATTWTLAFAAGDTCVYQRRR